MPIKLKYLLQTLVVSFLIGFTYSMVMAQECPDIINITESDGMYTIAVTNIPEDSMSLGFKVFYDNTELTYDGFTNDDCLTADFDMFNVNPDSNPPSGKGVLIVGGFTIDPVSQGSSGCLVHLEFDKNVQSVASPICVDDLVDDFTGLCDRCGDEDCLNCCCSDVCIPCTSDADCDDQNECTTDTCANDCCENTPVTDDTVCDDGKFCTETDTCLQGECLGEGDPCRPLQCDELNDICISTATTSIGPTTSIGVTTSTIVLSTTTTSIQGISSTSTVPPATTIPVTTTIQVPPPICPTELIYGEYSEETEHLRSFKENILSKTSEGKELIKLYYELSPFIVTTMEADEEFKKDVKEMIDAVLLLLKKEVE